ncbi:MAG: PA3496 family putative envelope integrity protein [Halothiobacillaceae bacterium]
MNDKTRFDDSEDDWTDDETGEIEEEDQPLLESRDNKDARRRLDDLLEERRLRRQMLDDYD